MMRVASALLVALTACSAGGQDATKDMTSLQKDSFKAIVAYNACVAPHVQNLKRQELSPQAIAKELKAVCSNELNLVATKLAQRPDYRTDDSDYVALDQDSRIALIKAEFTEQSVCKVRKCELGFS